MLAGSGTFRYLRHAAVAELTAGSAFAQKPAAPAAQSAGGDELSRQATDPTAPLMQFSFIGDARLGYHGSDDDGFEFRFQPVVPFRAFGIVNILRVIAPYTISGPGAAGAGDISIFDITVVPRAWGKLAVGVVANLSQNSSAPFGIGPAIGAIIPTSKKLMVGLFNQNLFGSNVAISQFQPVVAYQLGNGWSLTAGDLQIMYDWNAGDFVQIPLGFQIGVVRPIAKQPVRLFVNPQWNVKATTGTWSTKVIVAVTVLSPLK